MSQSRRQFLELASAGAAGALAARGQKLRRILVEAADGESFRTRLAAKELVRGLEKLRLPLEVRFTEMGAGAAQGELVARFRVEPDRFGNSEAYEMAAAQGELRFTGASDAALPLAVFDFLERQGAFFGIDGESYPIEPVPDLDLPPGSQPWPGKPRFARRGLLPWPDFLNCITVYNEEDFLAYFEAMLRMRLNLFGMHVYTGGEQWAESYLSFEFGGAGHLAFLDTTATNRWGYLPVRTSMFSMGTSQFYDRDVFGSDATRLTRDPWETAEATRVLLRKAFAYARRLGIQTGIGFEPYQIPDEIWRALPPEVRPEQLPDRRRTVGRFDIESVTARKMLEARLGQLLEAYPDVDHVWLWEDEQMNWESRRTGVPLSVTPFVQARDFLRRHSPDKRLVVSGWGGVARHFEYFHEKLPGDVIFSCLSDSLGWDPVHEVFGKLENRERWPIPWLEDDPGMWQAQFHAHRFQRDVDLSEKYRCQGMLGIHWRHRIVDPTAGYFARAMWNGGLAPGDYYRSYARVQAAGQRGERLAAVLADIDKNRKLLSTWTGEMKDGHAVTQEFSGDYNEAFVYWWDWEPEPTVIASQKEVLEELRRLAGSAGSAYENERLGYLAGHVEFLVAYADCWVLAHRLHGVLTKAGELKKAGKPDEAGSLVTSEAVPLWMKLAPEVRRAMLAFQRIVATRNDLGTLASKHIKFVRLALYRLPLSIQEYLGEMPDEMENVFAEVTRPAAESAPRIFLPTRPGLLDWRTKTRVMIVAPGEPPPERVRLHLRLRGENEWQTSEAKLLGRRTYEAFLGPFPVEAQLVEYYVSAEAAGRRLTAPEGAPERRHVVTVI